MALKVGNRHQMSLIPKSIEEYVSDVDPVRVYDAFVDSLDLKELGIIVDINKVGTPQYDPRAMLKLLVYAYSYGVRSSRMIERACHHNISFMWITGGLKPDHKTISKFRKENIDAITKSLKSCVRVCIDLNLIEGNILFVDGTKIRANAGIGSHKDKVTLEKRLKHIDEFIEKLLKEIETVDKLEESQSSYVEMSKELAESNKLKEKVELALKNIEESNTTSINTTDKDAIKVKGRQGIHAGMNHQVVTDGKYGLIVSSDVVKEANDTRQLAKQINKANEEFDKPCQIAVGDAGYSTAEECEKLVQAGIEVIVPSQKQASHKKEEDKVEKNFDKSNFKYDKENDVYICPEGKVLKKNGRDLKNKKIDYRNYVDCLSCKYYGLCTKSKRGRSIKRRESEETAEIVGTNFETERAKAIYDRRKEVAELPFGYIKRFLDGGYFLLRGLENVNAEASIFCTCFNLRRMMTLLGGVRPMIEKLKLIG